MLLLLFRLLTRRYPQNENAENELQSQFMAYSKELMHFQAFLNETRPIGELKEALGIIKNIAPKCQEILRRDHFLQQILMLFRNHHEEMKQFGPLHQKSKQGDKILDIIEPCVFCVHTFVHDAESKRALFGHQNPPNKSLEEMFGVIDMLTDLLLHLNEQLKRNPSLSRKQILLVMKVTTNILMEIAQDKEGAFLIFTHCESKKEHPLIVLIQQTFDQPKLDDVETKIKTFAVDIMNEIQRVKNETNQGLFRPSEHVKRLANLHRNIPQGPPLHPQVCNCLSSMNLSIWTNFNV